MKSINALTLRKKLGSVLDDVVRSRAPVTISRGNKPLVVIVPHEEYEHSTMSLEREKRLRLVAQRLAEWKKKHTDKLKDMDPVRALREIRDAGK